MKLSILGPAPKPKPVHRAKLIRTDGKVSPLCADKPRPINLARATWTLLDALVTCSKCLLRLDQADARRALEWATELGRWEDDGGSGSPASETTGARQ